jgi:hypothetical protein
MVRRYGEAGATTVVLQPAVTDLDIEAFIRLAAQTREALPG